MKPSIWNSRVWSVGAHAYRKARDDGKSPKVSRIIAAIELRNSVTKNEIEAALSELQQVGSVVYGIARRALRRMGA